MKKVININFQGRVIPIEETAYDVLKQYIDSLRRYFANEEGRDEIINDIEGRIGELFSEVLKKGSTCVTDDDVNAIIASMGRPEQFDDDEAKVQSQLGGQQQQSSSSSSADAGSGADYSYGQRQHGRFYRDENHKVVAGVCAGIGNYFGIDPLVIRILFVIFAFGFGFGFITYLVLWVAVPSTASAVIGSPKKRLFRDPDNKLIAGVCSGLAQYFGVNVWIPRVLFLIPFISIVFRWHNWGAFDFPNFLSFSFSPGTLLLYIILWIIFPEAQTTAEKLEMKGERVDLNNIKNTIKQDMEGFKDRAEKFGKEVGEKAQQFGKDFGNRGRQFSSEAGGIARRGGSGIGYVIGLMVKIFVYFVLGCVLFGIVVGLFSAGIALTGLLPLKEYIISDGWQNIFAWGTLLLFIWVPVVGIITWIIRRVAKMRSNARTIRFAFVSLWLLGLFCFVGLLASLRQDFRYHNDITEQEVELANPSVDKLTLQPERERWYYSHNFLHFEPFAHLDDDTVFVNNFRLRIIKSPNDKFHVIMAKMADGGSKQQANNTASRINYSIVQKDSTLILDKGIRITPSEKFRNQVVYITVQVPVGKRIEIGNNVGWYDHFDINFGWDNDWRYREDFFDDVTNWETNVEYRMKSDGHLERTDRRRDNDDNNNDENNDMQVQPNSSSKDTTGTYHYKETQPKQEQPAKKPAVNKKDSLPGKQAKADMRVTLPTAFIQRFSI
ncbi:MAG TPA: PspC domain-containing protein [Chitinophagaceae bacterium]|nr:PspC domain-containing protein [Chitinophagaceae bacterium]